jgi:hypothetical protein
VKRLEREDCDEVMRVKTVSGEREALLKFLHSTAYLLFVAASSANLLISGCLCRKRLGTNVSGICHSTVS